MSDHRFGTSLLAFTILRPPDKQRSKGVKHFLLNTPQVVADEIEKWQRGEREQLDPREASDLLWTTATAIRLDGSTEGWKSLPGMRVLLPAFNRFVATEQINATLDQTKLIKSAFELDPATADWTTLKSRLNNIIDGTGVTNVLNDLLLIFKYAAVGTNRPIATVADLYKFARIALAEIKDDDSTDVTQQLRAPIGVPRVFGAPLGPSGPRAPRRAAQDNGDLKNKYLPFELGSKEGQELVARLRQDMDEISNRSVRSKLTAALTEAGVTEAHVHDKIAANLVQHTAKRPRHSIGRVIRERHFTDDAARPRYASRLIGGYPVTIDQAALHSVVEAQERNFTAALLDWLPDDLRDELEALDLSQFEIVPPTLPDHPDPTRAPTPSYLEPVGRTDLLLVRQATIGYRRAEIAHVENVMIGESRQRKHQKRVLTQDEFLQSTEVEREETADLQSTDRTELNREISDVTTEDARVEGSFQVSSRGATKVVAKTEGAFERSSASSVEVASKYAKETVERAVRRLFERNVTETRRLLETEVTEDNIHGFTRADSETSHVSGVYQYLERISHCRVYSYGERDVYDILVPEPSALIWKLAEPQPVDGPRLNLTAAHHELFASLTLENIGDKIEDVIRAFKVVDIPVKPKDEQITFDFSGTGSGANAKLARSASLKIPDGYVAVRAVFNASAEHDGGNTPNGGVVIGNLSSVFNLDLAAGEGPNSYIKRLEFNNSAEFGQVSSSIVVGVNLENFQSTAGGIQISLAVTPEMRRDWAMAAYQSVAQRYEQLRLEDEQAVVRQDALQPDLEYDIPAGARRRLERLVRHELQRSAVAIMRNSPVSFDLVSSFSAAQTDFPTTDLNGLRDHEATIRFLHQAFEWEHMAWVLYPYYWGRRSQWANVIVQDHPDPDFAEFLSAGAARLQISVRPGFEDLVKHFMETGEVYFSNGLPKMGDPGYLPFIDEQMNSAGAPGEELPWPLDNPVEWDVVAPTPLVILRAVDKEQLPKWKRSDGGEDN